VKKGFKYPCYCKKINDASQENKVIIASRQTRN
jgi:hypothetical protein